MALCAGCNRTAKVADDSSTTSLVAKEESKLVSVTAVPVQVRPVKRHISVVGTLLGFEKIAITPKVEGRVQTIHFDVGDRVPPGTVMLELDERDYRLALNEAERAVEQELAKLGVEQPPNDDFNMETLPSVIRARLLLENAQQKFGRQQKLASAKASSGEAYEQAETELKVAEALQLQSRLDAQSTLAAVRHKQAVVEQARERLSETRVFAPIVATASNSHSSQADYVVSKRMVSVGEMVRAFPSTAVLELVSDETLKLHIMVPERYMSQVQMGLDVEVRVEAYPKEVFPGKIARINPTVDPQSRSFDVEVQIPNVDHRLKHGGFAKAEVIAGTAAEALTVPIESVTRFAGVTKVFAVRDETAREVEVAIGTQGPGWVEVLGNLQAGDRVVTSGQSRLTNGTPVVVRETVAETARR